MPALSTREQEAKFQVAPDTHPALFAQAIVFDDFTVQSIGTVNQLDTYLDTPAFDLLRQGIALRVRHNGARAEVGIKSIQATRKGSIQDRMDIAIPLPAHAQPLDATTWPNAVTEQLAPFAIKPAHLRPLLVVRQARQKAKLVPVTGTLPFAEWSLDTVWLDRATGDPLRANMINGTQQDQVSFYELEIELLATKSESSGEGSSGEVGLAGKNELEEAFTTLVRETQARFDLRPLYVSKFVRGLETEIARAHGNAHNVTPKMTLAEAGRLLLHQQLFQLMLNEHGVRQQASKGTSTRAVHEMRVAIRRMRAALQLCASTFPAAALRPFEKALRRLSRALGHVRDLDVALANLRAFRHSQPEVLHKGIKLLRAELRNRRGRAHTDLVALLDSKKHRKFIIKGHDFCTTPAEMEQTETIAPHAVAPTQVHHTLPSRILAAFEAVRAYETVFATDDLPPLETFHALRIQAKYLRYLLEFTQHLLGAEGDQLIDQLRELQEHLGELNDAHVEQTRLRLWVEVLPRNATLRVAIEARLQEIAAAIHALTTSTPAKLATLTSQSQRETLGLALARL